MGAEGCASLVSRVRPLLMCLGKRRWDPGERGGGGGWQRRLEVDGRWERDWFLLSWRPRARSDAPEGKFPREMQGLSAAGGSVLFLLRGLLVVDGLLGLWLFWVSLGLVRGVEHVH